MEHAYRNQFKVDNFSTIYDVEAIILYADLAKFCKEKFGTNIELSDENLELSKKVRDKMVYGNIQYPINYTFREHSWGEEIELLYNYEFINKEFPNGLKCTATYGDYTKEKLISLLEQLHEFFVLEKNIFNISVIKLMSYYDMPYICNANEVANKIVNYYTGLATNITDGIKSYENKTKKSFIKNI